MVSTGELFCQAVIPGRRQALGYNSARVSGLNLNVAIGCNSADNWPEVQRRVAVGRRAWRSRKISLVRKSASPSNPINGTPRKVLGLTCADLSDRAASVEPGVRIPTRPPFQSAVYTCARPIARVLQGKDAKLHQPTVPCHAHLSQATV